MPTYQYVAQDIGGRSDTGVLTAPSRVDAIHNLQDRRLTPISLDEIRKQNLWRTRVPQSAMVNCLTGMADLLESGMPLLKTLDLVANQVTHAGLREALREIHNQVADGKSLASAMHSQPGVFNELSTSMIAVGEEGGFLEQALQRVATLTERQAELRGHLLGALAYPVFLLVAGVLVSFGMLIFFVPLFEPLFERMRERGELPWATTMLLSFSANMKEFCLPILMIVFAFALMLRSWLASEVGMNRLDRLKLTLFGIGPIMRDLTISHFSHILGTLLTNGVSLIRSLELAEKSLGNREMAASLREATVAVSSGGSLAEPLARSGLFPPDITETIAMGEQSNRLEHVLLGLAERLERRAQKQLNLLTKMLEPALMTVLACMIGFLIIALLMPIFASSGRFN